MDTPSIWTPTLEKVTKDLERWDKGHPTIDERRLIIGMVVGGRMQYKTCVQGMPVEIEQRLTRMIRHFIWGGTAQPTIGIDTLSKPIEQGEKKLLDVKVRNEAIELMKMKRYLNFSETRPTWAKIADALIKMKLNKKWKVENDGAYQNVFLQTLTVNAKDIRDGLPTSLRRIIRTARKHEVTLPPAGLKLKTNLDMPIWYHGGLKDRENIRLNNTVAKCLRTNHRLRKIDDAIKEQP